MRNDKSQVIGLARKLAGKTEDGSAPVDKVDGERELVTQVTPILMSRPLWSSVPAQVQWTDALQGVELNDLIIVQTRGIGHRVGIALVTPKSLSDKFESEQVGTVNGEPLTVGGSVNLSASDVGALPETATASDVGAMPENATASDVGAASSNHKHNFTFPTLPSPPVNTPMSAPDPYNWTWGNHVVDVLYAHHYVLQDLLNALDGVNSTGNPTT